MVKTVTFYIKKILEKSKKQEEEAGPTFLLLSQSRNVILKFMESYLNRPITVLQFLTPGRIQKCLT